MIVLKLFTDRWSDNYNYQAGAEHAPLEASGGWASSSQTTNPYERSKERSVRQVEKYRTQPLVSFARKSSNHRRTTRRHLVSSDQKDRGRICRRNGPVRNYRGKSFRKEDFDPRTTVTVKKKYSEGREALEDIKTESNPRSDTTDNLSETPRRSSNATNSV